MSEQDYKSGLDIWRQLGLQLMILVILNNPSIVFLFNRLVQSASAKTEICLCKDPRTQDDVLRES